MPERGWLIRQYRKMDEEVKSWPRSAQKRLEEERASGKRIVEESLAKKSAARDSGGGTDK